MFDRTKQINARQKKFFAYFSQEQRMKIIASPGSLTTRRPVCAAEVFVIADALRKSRTTEFALPNELSLAEVRLLYFLRGHGDFIKRQGTCEQQRQQEEEAAAAKTASSSSSSLLVSGAAVAAAKAIASTTEAIRDLCKLPTSAKNNNNGSNQNEDDAHVGALSAFSSSSSCVLSEDEVLQLVDLRITTEVDLYKVIPDIDLRLGSEAKVAPLLALLGQLK